MDFSFWKGRRVFLTGHTGFKGSWMCQILTQFGADLMGYSLGAPTTPNLYEICDTQKVNSVIGDILDQETLKKAFVEFQPEIVMHMAAQPIVRESYKDPAYTFNVNIMGTVNILECVRNTSYVKSFLNITTDKVYENKEWEWGYREIDPLDGLDPYSNSKSCSELVTHSYRSSFFSKPNSPAISTARAGNVIGGGDFASDRIIPDCVRAAIKSEPIIVRNPHSIRPYQHVLEPLFAYLSIAEKQYGDAGCSGYYNVGPDDCDCVTTGELVTLFCSAWGNGLTWENRAADGPHEANFLKLDCSKIKSALNWNPRWHVDEAICKTVEWAKAYLGGKDLIKIMRGQIHEYINAPGVEPRGW